MGETAFRSPGQWCWPELATTDTEGAKAFYGGLFGWSIQESRQLGFTYVQFLQDGLPVGGLMPRSGPEWAGLPDHFMQYFVVADCAASVARAGQLGGRTCVPPKPVPTVGTFAILEDPGGAAFGILQPEQSA